MFRHLKSSHLNLLELILKLTLKNSWYVFDRQALRIIIFRLFFTYHIICNNNFIVIKVILFFSIL